MTTICLMLTLILVWREDFLWIPKSEEKSLWEFQLRRFPTITNRSFTNKLCKISSNQNKTSRVDSDDPSWLFTRYNRQNWRKFVILLELVQCANRTAGFNGSVKLKMWSRKQNCFSEDVQQLVIYWIALHFPYSLIVLIPSLLFTRSTCKIQWTKCKYFTMA